MASMIKNVVLISPDFPRPYYQFAKAFKQNGCNVLAIGSTPYNDLHPELKSSVTEYYQSYEMENIDRLCDIVGYFQNKYGKIDFVESNNEYWLKSDAQIRERFGIDSGLHPHELANYQSKSWMKKSFMNAGASVAPFIVSDNLDELKEFAKKYHYPLFAKPDTGVGAFDNHKLNNEEDLVEYLNEKPNIPYIVEAFVEGQIITFDGIANANSEVVVAVNEIFPREIFNIHNTGDDMFYYVNKEMPPKLLKLGKNIVKSFGLKNRFFHTELFVAENDVEGWFKKGDIVGLEINIRTPGGFTPDLLNFSLSVNLYQMYADVICFGESKLVPGERYYAMCSSRRWNKSYFFSEEDILRTYKNNVCFYGDYPDVLSDIMGNKCYMAKFKEEKDALVFAQYVKRKTDVSYFSDGTTNHIVGEDKRILDEKNQSSSSDLSICDTHIDGA